MQLNKWFTHIAEAVSHATGHAVAFIICCVIVIIWAATGPICGFSDTWQLIINTGTTIVTFLMVFLIQNTQNRDGAAIQAKLDELILTSKAENEFIGIEKLTEKELTALREQCAARAKSHSDFHSRVEAEIARRDAQSKKSDPLRRRRSKPQSRPNAAADG